MKVKKRNHKVLILGSDANAVINFRKELILEFLSSGLRPHIAVPDISSHDDLRLFCLENSISFSELKLNRYSTNIFRELLTLLQIIIILLRIRPDAVFSYTIKPNLYSLIAAFLVRIPHKFILITGLGFFFRSQQNRIVKKFLTKIYGYFLKKSDCIFFQNHDDKDTFKKLNLISRDQEIQIVAGSGVNLDHYRFKEITDTNTLSFLFIGRLLKDKGILEFLQAAIEIGKHDNQTRFKVLGWTEPSKNSISEYDLKRLNSQYNIEVINRVKDVRPIIESSHVLVHPSYHEGMPRSVLEAMSIGRPIITTDAPGCRESIIHKHNGYIVKRANVELLIDAINKFINNKEMIKTMSLKSRKLAEKKFDVRSVNREITNKIISKLPTI